MTKRALFPHEYQVDMSLGCFLIGLIRYGFEGNVEFIRIECVH